jgi:hypothetical protein
LSFLILNSCESKDEEMSEFQLITQKNNKIIFNSPSSDARLYLYETCQEAGATVSFFKNGCANYCSALEIPEMPICTQALTKSCLCPESMCYDKDQNICRRPRNIR